MNPRERERALASRSDPKAARNALKTNSLQTVDVRALTVLLFYPRCLGSGGFLINCSYQLQTQFIVRRKTDYGKANGFNSNIHSVFDLQIRKLQERGDSGRIPPH